MMTELTFVQNHIIKYIFDKGLSGDLCSCAPDDPIARECGITISSEIKTQMLASRQLKEVLARYGALPDTISIVKWGNLHIFLEMNPILLTLKSKKSHQYLSSWCSFSSYEPPRVAWRWIERGIKSLHLIGSEAVTCNLPPQIVWVYDPPGSFRSPKTRWWSLSGWTLEKAPFLSW